MSYDIKLTKPNDSQIIEEDQIVDYDFLTVYLNKPLNTPYNSTANIKVRINDFVRITDFKTEVLIVEDVSDQIKPGNNSVYNNETYNQTLFGLENANFDTFYVQQGPIYDGLKIGNLATYTDDVFVKIKIENEDVSAQFTGNEDYFVVEGKPITRSNYYDFNSLITKEDFIITKNSIVLTQDKIADFNAKTGRIQLVDKPILGDVITITYWFKPKIKEIDAINSKIVLKEKPKLGQTVLVQYYARVNDGWQIMNSDRSISEYDKKIVFYRHKNTNRCKISNENISAQITGKTNFFKLANKPLLPLHQDFTYEYEDALNNSVIVTVNGIVTPVYKIDSVNGTISLYVYPQIGDIVLATYYYENEMILDRISIDYPTDQKYNSRYSGNTSIADYFVNKLGYYDKVINEYKLMQDLKKIIVTARESDPVALWYGTNFASFIGTKQLPEYIKTRITSEIVEALSRLKSAQIQQKEYQIVTDEEFLNYIYSIETTRDEIDPTYYRSRVVVVSQSGRPYEITEVITSER
jgi:hypothetical protein